MKGFARILESIIASIILLTSMTFFLTQSVLETGWDMTLTQTESQDALAVLYKNGSLMRNIRVNNVTSLNNDFSKIFSPSIDFSVEIDGLVNPEINIGCNCTEAQMIELRAMLLPLDFNYTGRNVSIRISSESIAGIRNEANILFIFGYKNLNPYKNQLNNFLGRGGTIFMLADLTKSQVEDGYLNDTFGLKWYDIGNPASNGEFYDTINPANIAYKISKYFVNISGMPETTQFQKFSKGNDINHIDMDNKTIVKDASSRFSFVKINRNIVNSYGRTIWFADYTPHTDAPTNYLLKAAVMWASGERYKMDLYKKIYPKTYTRIRYILFDKDPYEVEFTVWKVFY